MCVWRSNKNEASCKNKNEGPQLAESDNCVTCAKKKQKQKKQQQYQLALSFKNGRAKPAIERDPQKLWANPNISKIFSVCCCSLHWHSANFALILRHSIRFRWHWNTLRLISGAIGCFAAAWNTHCCNWELGWGSWMKTVFWGSCGSEPRRPLHPSALWRLPSGKASRNATI